MRYPKRQARERAAGAKALTSSPSARRNWTIYTEAHRRGEAGIRGSAPVTKTSMVSKAAREEATEIAAAILSEKDPRERNRLIKKLYEILP